MVVKKRKIKKEDVRFVKIDSPNSTRRDILESAIQATNLLKRWESYKRIKEKKMLYLKKLRNFMVKIHNEEMAFRRHFPDAGEIDVVSKNMHKEKRKHLANKIPNVTSSLDKEIDEIRSKLNKIEGS